MTKDLKHRLRSVVTTPIDQVHGSVKAIELFDYDDEGYSAEDAYDISKAEMSGPVWKPNPEEGETQHWWNT